MNASNPAITGVFFDTHASVKELRQAGFTEEQAEAQTKILSRLVEKDLVTKGYLDIKMKEIDARFRELEAKLDSRIQQAKAETVKWMLGALLAQTGLIAALVKLL